MTTVKKLIALLCTVSLLFCFAGCGSENETNPADLESGINSSGQSEPSGEPAEGGIGTHHAVITVKDMGEIKLELYGDTAPVTVQNFIDLANAKFYDGLTFHRVDKGFMIQGGDPNGNGTGGSGKEIKGEFTENGFNNPISHTRGVISMARAGNPYNDAPYYNTASSQFFIMHEDTPAIDGKYAAFGKVTEGMAIVDKIANTPVTDAASGAVAKENQPIIESIRITD